jgi:hypothetical protein
LYRLSDRRDRNPPATGAAEVARPAGNPAGHRRRRPWLLYLGVLLAAALAAVTVLAVEREGRLRTGQSRGQAIYELVQDTVPSRPSETPGVAAWLHLELKQYRHHIADPLKARLYGEIVDWHDEASLPPFLAGLRAVLAAPGPPPSGGVWPAADLPRAVPTAALAPPGEGLAAAGGATAGRAGNDAGGPGPGAEGPLPLRVQRYLELRGHWFAFTRRRGLDTADLADLSQPSNIFLLHAAHHLLAAGDALQAALARAPLPAVPAGRAPRVVRIYAVGEDGTLVSEPFAGAPAGASGASGAAGRRAAALDEGREFRKLPQLPTFVPNEFIFRFDFGAPQAQAYYSGLYLDLGGQGVVATLLVPVRAAERGFQGVIAADLTFDIDWQDFAVHLEPPMTAAVVRLAVPVREPWLPWAAMAAHLPPGAPGGLRGAVGELAAAEGRGGRAVSPFYLYHGAVPERGAVAALQVAATTWLVTLFPATHSRFALVPALLLALLCGLLLISFDASRRRTERAQHKAERELQEKQNLLNTMQVPLMVVDPNTDEVVYGNQAAVSLGIAGGIRARDLVADDPRARAHYARMQVAEQGSRRAYGVPLRVRGEAGGMETRYAIVRSVAVTAPIEALHADERHRLGVLFLVEPEADLALWRDDLVGATRADERRKLAGLLAHGLDALARVLAQSLADPAGVDAGLGAAGSSGLAFERWLAAYLERRVLATAWLLEHWDAEPPLPPDCSIEAAQARATIDAWQAVFARVRGDAGLRSRLHWDNGVLAGIPEGGPASGGAVLSVSIDWPEDHWFAAPLRGGFGFFLGEVLVNAIRHGRAGSVPRLQIALDPVRRELLFTVDNEVVRGAGTTAERAGRSYGGRRILERLALLCGWNDLRFRRTAGGYEVSWRVPVSQRGERAGAD